MRRSTGRMPLFFAVILAVPMPTVGLRIPAWMFDQSACAKVRVVADAHADLVALTTLAAFVRHVLNDQFVSSNVPLSGASSLSREQNRREVHATPDEADAGATPRAAANRPVHRSTADGHRCSSQSNNRSPVSKALR